MLLTTLFVQLLLKTLQYLGETTVYSDETVDLTLAQFAQDLEYWSSTLGDDFHSESSSLFHSGFLYVTQLLDHLHDPDVRRYLDELSVTMIFHFDSLIEGLKRYREVGKSCDYRKFLQKLNLMIHFLIKAYQPFSAYFGVALISGFSMLTRFISRSAQKRTAAALQNLSTVV